VESYSEIVRDLIFYIALGTLLGACCAFPPCLCLFAPVLITAIVGYAYRHDIKRKRKPGQPPTKQDFKELEQVSSMA
jgi:hypothetical protein